jgi:AcrR family transcriptional regulator
MKCEAEVKELLISNAIHLIAEGGFEKATTKELTHSGGHLPNFKMNEVYIYRFFKSKENLYEAAFLQLDMELYYAFKHGVEMVGGFEDDRKERLCRFFSLAWQFVLGDEERCRCYVRYYYSIYFRGRSREAHRKLFDGIVSEMKPIFKEEADVEAILHSVFTALFDFAIRVYNGELEDDEINRSHISNVLYCMMMTYFKDSVKAS